MRWYDLFSLTYDRALEATYRPYRARLAAAARLRPGQAVLDLACGTGQTLPFLVDAVGPEGRVVGLDASAGMLRRARRRVDDAGWRNVTLLEGDVDVLVPDVLAARAGLREVDAVVCALGMTAFPDAEAATRRALSVLRPGGRLVVFDVHADVRTFQTRLVEWVARADLDRRAWEPLERLTDEAEREALEGDPATFGGTLYLASGVRRPD